MKVYGPYRRKDGRQHVIVINDDGSRRTVSYPKWLVEQRTGRLLSSNETVDHIDKNIDNNDDSNLQVLDRAEHIALDVRRRKTPESLTCSWCSRGFVPTRNQISTRSKNHGKFCSKACSGKYGKHVQSGGKRTKPVVIEHPGYYTLKQEPHYRKVLSGDDDIGETFDNGNSEGT